ncbi:YhhN-like protein [Thelonectria olida]|uniref:YhhN-like protein n=1 Tax=Thelonectria olida TaxID=1576542 RepID=A0A9P9AJH2_9HYPO|nr:YhhN-like protein [Thelonectria olida]
MAFQYTATELENALLILSLSTALTYGCIVHSQPSQLRMVTKTLSIGILSVLSAVTHGPKLLGAAQAFGALGDGFLAWTSDEAFLRGLASFLAAHVFYIILFAQKGHGLELFWSEPWRIPAACSMALLTCVLVGVLLPRVPRDLQIPISVYSSAILSMVFAALTMTDHFIVLGALLFTMSDGILATGRFLVPATSRHQTWMEYGVWSLYYSGQLLIHLGMKRHS